MTDVKTTGFKRVLLGAIQDVQQMLPELRCQPLESDLDELIRRTETRGLGVILVDLPELGKVFDKGLSSGFFNQKKLPHTMVRNDGKVMFHTLIAECFDCTGRVLDDVDSNVVLSMRQLCLMFKKFSIECPDKATRDAVKDFIDIERGLYSPTNLLCWNEADFTSYESDYRPVSFSDLDDRPTQSFPRLAVPQDFEMGRVYQMLRILQEVADHIVVRFPELDIYSILPKHGHGAVSDLRSGTYKYQFPSWPDRLERVFPWGYFTSHVGDLETKPDCNRPSGNEPLGRLIAVPKTYKGPRLITVEPTAHQYCQQALLRYLRASMPRVLRQCIDFTDQTPSQEAAREASISGKFGTVDLSSASDRLTCWVVERAFRRHPHLLDALAACRTRFIRQDAVEMTPDDTNYQDKYIQLKKFSGQGSAVTFPIQSMIYAMISITAVIYNSAGWVNPRSLAKAARSIRVFGDDLVVPSNVVPDLALLLGALQLRVNVNKTHFNGFFRESCGLDAYKGIDVTPTYVTSLEPEDTPSGLSSWVDMSNNVFLNGWWRTAKELDAILDHRGLMNRVPISRYNLECINLRTFVDGTESTLWRFNERLQRDEVKGLTVHTSSRLKQDTSLDILLQYFTERGASSVIHTGMTAVRRLIDPGQGRMGHVEGNRDRLRSRWVRAY